MASLLAFTQSVRFGGDDAVLIAAIRAWPKGDDWTVILNAAHPGHEIYEEELAGRARVLPADVTADGEGAASFVLGAASRLSPCSGRSARTPSWSVPGASRRRR